METIWGRKSLALDLNGLKKRLAEYDQIALDLGTGDGRYVRAMAEHHPDRFIVGVDACRENLREHSKAKLPNALFVIASAQELPEEFNGLISHITINFPWGSLLNSLLSGDDKLMDGLGSIVRARTSLTLHLNGGALAEAGTTLEDGVERIYNTLTHAGWQIDEPLTMDETALRKFPSTWARRLAFGRDPRAVSLKGLILRK